MELGGTELLSTAFGVWAATIGLGVRYMVRLMDRHEARIDALEKKISRLEWEIQPKSEP